MRRGRVDSDPDNCFCDRIGRMAVTRVAATGVSGGPVRADPFPSTAARWEKSVAALLNATGARVYLPLMSRVSVYRTKTRAAHVPVFPGYVFCDEDDFLVRSKANSELRAKVAQMLRPPDPGRLRAELKDIADLLTDRKLVQERLVGDVGDVVRIVGGSLAGYGGKIVRVSPNRWVVVVEMSFLGARREVEVDERMIERVERRP